MKRFALNILLIIGCTSIAYAQFPSNIGKLPSGKTITICYEVSVDEDTPINTSEVCEQGVISYNDPNMAGTLNLKTDDPTVVGAEDPTCTMVVVCDITSITAGNRACEQGSTTYSQDVTIDYAGGSGDLEIDANGMTYSFPLSASPQTVTLTGLPIDGNPVTVMASFSTSPASCSKTETDLFTAPTLLSVNAGADQMICQGETANLSASAAGGSTMYDYAWTPGNIPGAMTMVNPGTTTTYTATVTDALGCIATDDVMVTVLMVPPAPGPIAGPATICGGLTNLLYAITPVPNATSYTWSFSDASATINGTGTQVSIDFDGTFSGGTLTVIANNSCGPSTATNLMLMLGNTELCEIASCLSENEALIIDNTLINALSVFQNYNRIESGATINSPRNVTFKAGNEILLNPPFEVKLGATFIAEIEACLQSKSHD